MAKGCILVVDDEHILEELYQDMLASAGYSHVSFNDAREALNYLMVNSSRMDLAVIDLSLPFMTGAELANEMGEIDPDLPVLMVTGQLETEHTDNNVRAALQKPVARAELLKAVQKYRRRSPAGRCA